MDRLSKLLIFVLIFIIIAQSNPVIAETVTDALNRRVNITRTERIISLSPAITEILAELGLLDRVVGADEISLSQCWYLNASKQLESKGVKSIGGYWGPSVSIEKILELRPDLVIAEVGAHIGLRETFESYGVNVIYIHGGGADSIEKVYADIEFLGRVFNRSSVASNLIQRIEDEISKYREKITKSYNNLSTLVIVDLTDGIWVAGKETYVDDLLEKLGLRNAVTIKGWAKVNIEQVYQWNPNIILVSTYYPVTKDILEKHGLTAFEKNIFVLNSSETDIIQRPGPLLQYAPAVIYEKITSLIPATVPDEKSYTPYVIMVASVAVVALGLLLYNYLSRKKKG